MTKEQFLQDLNGTSNHRILLWEALQLTDGPVVEFGSGYGSTPYLDAYCHDNKRPFSTYDNNKEWAAKMDSVLTEDWDKVFIPLDTGVLLIDHAPGERRKKDIVRFKNTAKIIVCHDTELAADHGYQMRQHFGLFKWGVEINAQGGGAGATILSNFIDLSVILGKTWDQYEITHIQL